MIRIRAKPEPVRRFEIGQSVHLKAWFATPLRTDETYVVTACLPFSDKEFRYRIRAENERHDRVAGEDALELVESGAQVERTN